jgi:hypothetical protein
VSERAKAPEPLGPLPLSAHQVESLLAALLLDDRVDPVDLLLPLPSAPSNGSTTGELVSTCASALGPARAARALTAPGVPLEQLLAGVAALPAPPLRPARLLVALRRAAAEDPAGVDRALVRLEQLLQLLPEDPNPSVVRPLGLPRVLGVIIDLRVLTGELGAPQRSELSAALILQLCAEHLRVSSVLSLTVDPAGVIDPGMLPVETSTLEQAISSSMLLGAHASALRYAVLVLLLNPRDRWPELVVRTARQLVIRRSALVPSELVVPVWSFLHGVAAARSADGLSC